MSETAMCYIGRAECGCVQAIYVDDPEHLDYTANAVSEMILGGLKIERVPIEDTKLDWTCPHQMGEVNNDTIAI